MQWIGKRRRSFARWHCKKSFHYCLTRKIWTGNLRKKSGNFRFQNSWILNPGLWNLDFFKMFCTRNVTLKEICGYCQWPPFGTKFPKRDSILSNQENILPSWLDKMLSLFGQIVAKGGHWQTAPFSARIFLSRSEDRHRRKVIYESCLCQIAKSQQGCFKYHVCSSVSKFRPFLWFRFSLKIFNIWPFSLTLMEVSSVWWNSISWTKIVSQGFINSQSAILKMKFWYHFRSPKTRFDLHWLQPWFSLKNCADRTWKLRSPFNRERKIRPFQRSRPPYYWEKTSGGELYRFNLVCRI